MKNNLLIAFLFIFSASCNAQQQVKNEVLEGKWYLNFQHNHFTEANFDLIIEGIHATDVLCLKIIPKPTVFKGNIYILTNGNTASTCEPIVYGLKQHKRAAIIGEKTAGAMLNGEIFEIDKGFKMVIPTADYYASDGFR